MMASGVVSLVLSRQGEVYWNGQPLDWVVPPTSARFDRKRAWMSWALPVGAVLELFDGYERRQIEIADEAGALHLRAARVEGSFRCLDS